jgi:hypothetical protein
MFLKDILPDDEYHTSLGDMSATDILAVSKQFELIILYLITLIPQNQYITKQ